MTEEFRFDRKCGECFACCIALGINELRKWPDQTCKHLDASHGRDHMCSIYPTRPLACQAYYCAWLAGMFGEDMRPDKAGVMATFYPNTEGGPPHVTIHVTSSEKAGDLGDESSNLRHVVQRLLDLGINHINILLNGVRSGSTVVFFKNGLVYVGVTTKPSYKGYEELNFVSSDKPIGAYVTVPQPQPQPKVPQPQLQQEVKSDDPTS